MARVHDERWWLRSDVCRVGAHQLEEDVRELTLVPSDPATSTGIESLSIRCCPEHESELDAWIARELPGLVRAPEGYRRPSLPPPSAQLWNMGRRDDLVVVDGLRGESFPLRRGQHERIGSGSGCEIRLTQKDASASSAAVACYVRVDEEGKACLDHVWPRAVLRNGVVVDVERTELRHGDTIGIVAKSGHVLLQLGYAAEKPGGGPMALPARPPPARDFFAYREPYLLPAPEGRSRELVVDAAGTAHLVEHTNEGRVVASSKLNETMVRGLRDVVTRPIFAPLTEAPEGDEAPLVVLFERPLPRIVFHDRQGPAYGDAGPAWMFETLVRRILFDMTKDLGTP